MVECNLGPETWGSNTLKTPDWSTHGRTPVFRNPSPKEEVRHGFSPYHGSPPPVSYDKIGSENTKKYTCPRGRSDGKKSGGTRHGRRWARRSGSSSSANIRLFTGASGSVGSRGESGGPRTGARSMSKTQVKSGRSSEHTDSFVTHTKHKVSRERRRSPSLPFPWFKGLDGIYLQETHTHSGDHDPPEG